MEICERHFPNNASFNLKHKIALVNAIRTPLLLFLSVRSKRFFSTPHGNAHISRLSEVARELIKQGAELPQDSGSPLDGLGGINCLPLHRRAMIGLSIREWSAYLLNSH